MLVHDCIPCQHGDHDGHAEIVSGAIPGLIGSGQECQLSWRMRGAPSATVRGGRLPSELPEGWPGR